MVGKSHLPNELYKCTIAFLTNFQIFNIDKFLIIDEFEQSVTEFLSKASFYIYNPYVSFLLFKSYQIQKSNNNIFQIFRNTPKKFPGVSQNINARFDTIPDNLLNSFSKFARDEINQMKDKNDTETIIIMLDDSQGKIQDETDCLEKLKSFKFVDLLICYFLKLESLNEQFEIFSKFLSLLKTFENIFVEDFCMVICYHSSNI